MLTVNYIHKDITTLIKIKALNPPINCSVIKKRFFKKKKTTRTNGRKPHRDSSDITNKYNHGTNTQLCKILVLQSAVFQEQVQSTRRFSRNLSMDRFSRIPSNSIKQNIMTHTLNNIIVAQARFRDEAAYARTSH